MPTHLPTHKQQHLADTHRPHHLWCQEDDEYTFEKEVPPSVPDDRAVGGQGATRYP